MLGVVAIYIGQNQRREANEQLTHLVRDMQSTLNNTNDLLAKVSLVQGAYADLQLEYAELQKAIKNGASLPAVAAQQKKLDQARQRYDRATRQALLGVGKKNPARWGERAGRGVQPEGGLRESQTYLVRGDRNLCGKHANLLKLLVSKEPFFFISGALHVANAGLMGNPGKLIHRQSQQIRRTSLGHILRYLIVHGSSLKPELGPDRLALREGSYSCRYRRPSRLRSSS